MHILSPNSSFYITKTFDKDLIFLYFCVVNFRVAGSAGFIGFYLHRIIKKKGLSCCGFSRFWVLMRALVCGNRKPFLG